MEGEAARKKVAGEGAELWYLTQGKTNCQTKEKK